MPQVSVRFDVALAVCVVLIAAIVVWQVIAAQKRPLDAEDMKIDVADLASYAAEGHLLAKQGVGTSITRAYSKVQSEMWRDKIEEIVRKYSTRVPAADLMAHFEEVRAVAQRLLTTADAVTGDLANEGKPTAAAVSNLTRIESDAHRLQSRLLRIAS
jgi:hypothetical protein